MSYLDLKLNATLDDKQKDELKTSVFKKLCELTGDDDQEDLTVSTTIETSTDHIAGSTESNVEDTKQAEERKAELSSTALKKRNREDVEGTKQGSEEDLAKRLLLFEGVEEAIEVVGEEEATVMVEGITITIREVAVAVWCHIVEEDAEEDAEEAMTASRTCLLQFAGAEAVVEGHIAAVVEDSFAAVDRIGDEDIREVAVAGADTFKATEAPAAGAGGTRGLREMSAKRRRLL
eukprot:g2456.t1